VGTNINKTKSYARIGLHEHICITFLCNFLLTEPTTTALWNSKQGKKNTKKNSVFNSISWKLNIARGKSICLLHGFTVILQEIRVAIKKLQVFGQNNLTDHITYLGYDAESVLHVSTHRHACRCSTCATLFSRNTHAPTMHPAAHNAPCIL